MDALTMSDVKPHVPVGYTITSWHAWVQHRTIGNPDGLWRYRLGLESGGTTIEIETDQPIQTLSDLRGERRGDH